MEVSYVGNHVVLKILKKHFCDWGWPQKQLALKLADDHFRDGRHHVFLFTPKLYSLLLDLIVRIDLSRSVAPSLN